ncbi:hypothetical protein [Ruminococcus flavefaciens]|uniref:Uncharacterized protein n=1 Tax=Ruminococcus flavefaciens TaxID=1265 RepID=A0A315YKM5_RUMFL|nr:hypothetical protein [Ruminococcus flavefaciens]PWJ11962.1 hypothetical protein IE37_02227 [Ruminococcus flavefaciens]SSA50272.1 hypothetical protein SAMN02910325_02227 [Ruminococcus flavefaciens]
MAKSVNLNGMKIKVIDSQEKDSFLTQDDKDMDIRANAAVKAALNKAKICGKPIARYDTVTHRVYIENADGTIRFV